jgi:cell wall-associated NlpC family hydrolase
LKAEFAEMIYKLLLFILFIFLSVLPGRTVGQLPAPSGQEKMHQMKPDFRGDLISFAKGFLGVPYRYASAIPENGFDCSGFVHFVFSNFGINVPHSSKAFKNIGMLVKPEDFKVGDVLVFYGYRNATQIGHVGIICEAAGMNSKFIHASSGKVKEVIISELNSEMYQRRFFQCVDIITGK